MDMHSNIIGTQGRAERSNSGFRARRPFACLARTFVWLLLCAVCLACAGRAQATITANAVEILGSGCSSSPMPASYFSTNAPLVYDGSVGDTATGYTESYLAYVLWDMGSNVSLGGVRAQFTNASSSATAYYSTDGSTWTSLGSITSGMELTFSAVTARYIQFVFQGSGVSVTDTRVYDSSGNLVYGPGQAPPSAPTGLTATGGYSAVSLTWTAPSGSGLTYNVYRGTTSGGESSTAIASSLSSTSYTDTSVTNGTTYYYTVKATNSAGSSGASNEASATPQNAAPPAPTSLTATGGNAQVGLSWSAGSAFPVGSGSSGYNVYRGTSAGGESGTPIASGVSGTTYTDTGVTNGTTYYYTVKAEDAAGTSGASNEASATPAVPPSLTASAVTYYTYNSEPYAQPASDFTTAAPLVYDGSVGDTATGYSPSAYTICVLWDMGSNVSISGVRAQFTNASYGVYAYSSTDGNTWTSLGSVTSGSEQTFSAVTARYIQFALCGGYPSVTDTRLYDGSGNLVLGPGSSAPSAPTGLSATAGNQYVSLSWTAPSGSGITYNVYRGTTAGGEGSTAIASGLSGTSYTDSSAANGMAYYYTVKAVNGAGSSSASNEAHATPQGVAPSAPTNLTATAGNASVSLSWTAPAGSGLTYNVYRGTTSGGESATPINGSPLSATSYTDTNNGSGLTEGTTYYYVVKALNAYGTSPASNEASATPPLPAGAPTGLSASIGNARVSLTWNTVSGATSYNVKRATVSGGPYTTVSTAGSVTGGSYTDSGLTNGTTYYYVVSAVGVGGESANSSQVSATPTTSGLSAPTGLVATAYSTSISLNWMAVSGATSYNVYRGTSAGGESGTPYKTGLSSPSYSDGSVTSGTTYYYKVTAVGSGGESAFSNEASATPGSTALTAPELKGVAGSGQNVVTWSSVSGATSYNLYRYANGNYENEAIYQKGVTGTSFTDTGLTNGTQYSYYVAAVSVNGQGSSSNTVNLTPGSAALAAPSLAATANSSSVSLSWSAVTGATQYDLYRGTTSGGEGNAPYLVNVASVNNNVPSTSYTDSSVTSGTTYYYKVVAVGPGGEGALSNEASATAGTAPIAAPLLKGVAGSTSNALAWSAVTGATSYNLYRYSSGNYYGAVLYQQGLTATSFTDSGLTGGTQYSYYVCAVATSGQGNQSNTVNLTPGSAALAAPVLSASTTTYTSNGLGSISLSWTAVTGATQYDLYRSTTSGGEGSVPYLVNVSTNYNGTLSTSYSDSNLPPGTTYYYQVVAVGPGGEGASSNEASATVAAQPLAAPALKGVAGSSSNNPSNALAWSAVTGATSYNLYRYSSGNYYGATLYQQGLTGTTYTDTGVTGGTQYSYYVAAVNTSGQGSQSNAVSLTPGSAALAAPVLSATSSTYTSNGEGTISLTWSAVSGATQYDLYRGTSAGGEGSTPYQVNVSSNNGTSYTDSNLSVGQTYYYKVVAVGPGGEGALSNEASATVGASSPSAPTNLTATAASGGVQSIALSWTGVSGATSYDIFRYATTLSGNGYPMTTLYASGVTRTSYTDTNVAFGPTYTYAVAAVTTAGMGNESNDASATLYGFGVSGNAGLNPTPPPGNPAAVTVVRGTVGVVSMQVTPSGGYTGGVTLAGSGLPSGVNAWFYPGSVTLPTLNSPVYEPNMPGQDNGGAVSGNLYIAVASTATPGTYTLEITGNSQQGDGFTNTTTVTLTIQ